jgi:hypothetical protein
MSSRDMQERGGKAKVFSRTKDPKPIILTERDAVALEALWRHRCLSAEQLRRLVFRCGSSMLRRRLRALYDNGFIERVRVAAVPTQGVPPFLYTLTRSGAAILPELLGRFRPDMLSASGDLAGVSGIVGAGLKFVSHRHIVNETHVVLEEAAPAHGYSIHWLHEEDLTIGTTGKGRRAETITHPVLSEATTFLPDGFFELRLPGGGSLAFFVEVDMATHPQRVWRDRAKLYTAYADSRTGFFRRRFGRETFRLLIVTTNDYRQRSRCANILQTIRQTIGTSDMFLATTFDCLTSDRIFGPCWRTADGTNRRVSLVGNNNGTTSAVERKTPVVVRPRI